MAYPFRNLVFEGGGVKGIAYVGALEILEKNHILENIKRFGGTSAGAITALLLGIGYSVDEFRKEMDSVDFKKFKDDDFLEIRDTARLLLNGFGRYKGKVFMTWLEKCIDKKGFHSNITFSELKERTGKEVFFQGTNISTHRLETFSVDYTPNTPVIEAVRISMSIPFFFKSVEREGKYYVDGGLLDNFPIRLFDWKRFVEKEENYSNTRYYRNANAFIEEKVANEHFRSLIKDNRVCNKETLGLKLDSKAQIDAAVHQTDPEIHEIEDILDFTWHLISTIMSYQYNNHLNDNDADRTIYIDTGTVSATKFNLSREIKDKLIQSGKESAEKYILEYNNDTTRSNRPS